MSSSISSSSSDDSWICVPPDQAEGAASERSSKATVKLAALDSEIDRLMARQGKHVAEGGLALCRSRSLPSRDAFQRAYFQCVLQLQLGARPYYDPEEDSLRKLTYYTELRLTPGGAPTYDALSLLLSQTYRHANRRIGLWALIDRHQDGTLRCAYSGDLIETADCLRLQKADEEHLTPQSWHKGSRSHPGQDMHQIFVVSKKANGARGNALIGVGSDRQETSAAGLTSNGVVPSTGKAMSFFAPACNLGALCRAMLYALVAYRGAWHRAYFPPEEIAYLQQVGSTTPVSEWERHRNATLHELQGTRNPFVDFPHWASQMDFSTAFSDVSAEHIRTSKKQSKERGLRKRSAGNNEKEISE